VDPGLAVTVIGDFCDLGDKGAEALVQGNAALAPGRNWSGGISHFRDFFKDAAVTRMLVAKQRKAPLDGVLAGFFQKLIEKGFVGVSVVGVLYRAPPERTDTVFHKVLANPQVGNASR